jgi:hypothetical protein
MKGDRDHAVPLSDAAFSILLDIKRDQEEIDGEINPNGFVFARPWSDVLAGWDAQACP